MGQAPTTNDETGSGAAQVQEEVGPFGDKRCKHGVLIGLDCQNCLDYIRAIGRGERPDE